MIRQLPKLQLPAFIRNFSSTGTEINVNENTEIKVYDMINPGTLNNSEGNAMQLQLHVQDSEVNDGVRELHGRLTLTTENLPDKQDLQLGFVFQSDENKDLYDGIQLLTRVDHGRQT